MRTLSRIWSAWALCCVGWVLIASGDAAAASEPAILVLGDSLSAGYGLRSEQGWVALLQKRLQNLGYEHRVVNASVSGETTSVGLQRLPRALRLHAPEVVIVELGSNDGLRGLPLKLTRQNLTRIVEECQRAGAKVLLIGMRMPPNYGQRYTEDFSRMFGELAEQHDAALVPFLLEGVALDPKLMQEDGLHPNAPAQPILLDTVWPQLEPLLGER